MSTILVVDDDASVRTVLSRALVRAGHSVETAPTAAALFRLIDAGTGDLLVTDVMLPDANGLDLLPRIAALRPGMPVIVVSAQNTLMTAIGANAAGAFDYFPKPFDLDQVTSAVAAALAAAAASAPPRPAPVEALPMIGRSPAMQAVYRLIARLVPTDLPALILGESGTGKELVARALHDLGPRRASPFVAVNMAAIPRELIESELFGHERGAFTGAATARAGRFEQAEGGTLFLDEIGDMPIEAQTRLLRVLQSGAFTTVGGGREHKADVRIVSATNKDLGRLVASGTFREDLYYRLAVVPVELPPLRARPEDVPELARHFLARAEAEGLPRKALDPAAADTLARHSWPGNVRELENLMRRMAALTREDVLTAPLIAAALTTAQPDPSPNATLSLADALDLHLARYFAGFGSELPPDGLYDRVLAEIEPLLFRHSLAATGGNQIQAARLLGVNRNTLRKKLTERGVNPHAERG